MPTPFDSLNVKQAHDIVNQNRTKSLSGRDWYQENIAYIGFTTSDEEVDIDHWQGGKGFVAPLPKNAHPLHGVLVSGYKNAFVTENIMGEMTQRRKNGNLGKMPDFRFEFEGLTAEDEEEEGVVLEDEQGTPIEVPADVIAKRERLKQLNEWVKGWFEDKRALNVLRKFHEGLSAGAKCYMRMYVPASRFEKTVENSDGTTSVLHEFKVDSPEDALNNIYVECVDRQQANLVVHKGTMRQVGIIAFESEAGSIDALGQGSGGALKWAEITYVDPETNLTKVRVVYSDDRDPVEISADLGGRLILFEGNESLYLNEGIRSNQKDLNTTRTQLRIANDHTVLNRIIVTNAQPPTMEEVDASTGKKRLVVGEETGPGKVTHLAGYKFTGEDGKIYITNPDVHEIEPPDNEGIIRSLNESRSALYRLGKQGHMLMAGDATSSGEARIQAQADFIMDLVNVKSIIDEAGRWMIETLWAFANHLANTKVDEGLHVVFDSRIDPGHISEGLRRHIIERVGKGLLSKRMAMSLLGTDDVEAELRQIRREREEDQSQLEALQIERAQIAIERERGEDPADIAERRRQIEEAARRANPPVQSA